MNLFDPILSLLFPVSCGVCSCVVDSTHNGSACESCWIKTPQFADLKALCFRCGKPHPKPHKPAVTYCRQCDDDFYDAARAVGPYEGALAATVLHLKNTPSIAPRAADLMFETYVSAPFVGVDLVVPIPLSKKRHYERGFNQADLIARAFARRASLTTDSNSLYRTKHADVSRASMDRKGRALTVKNAFSVRRKSIVNRKTILLIDDVFTSGATVSMAAKALKKAGAEKVFVLTLSRAGKTFSPA